MRASGRGLRVLRSRAEKLLQCLAALVALGRQVRRWQESRVGTGIKTQWEDQRERPRILAGRALAQQAQSPGCDPQHGINKAYTCNASIGHWRQEDEWTRVGLSYAVQNPVWKPQTTACRVSAKPRRLWAQQLLPHLFLYSRFLGLGGENKASSCVIHCCHPNSWSDDK